MEIEAPTTGKTYTASYCILIRYDKIDKLEELLDRWNVENVLIKRLEPPGYYRVQFLTDDNKKIFVFRSLVEKYGGRVVRYNFQKNSGDASPTLLP